MAHAPRTPAADFELCPAGPQQLVCVDIIDLGMENTAFANAEPKMMPKVRLRFQTASRDSKGQPYIVQRKFTWSMHPRAALRKFVEGWLGYAFQTDAQADDFDFDHLLGLNGLTTVSHNTKAKGTFADIGPMMPLWPGMTPIQPINYQRQQPPTQAHPPQGPQAPPQPPQQAQGPYPPPPAQGYPVPPQQAPWAPTPPQSHPPQPVPGQWPQPGQMAPHPHQQPQPGQMAPPPMPPGAQPNYPQHPQWQPPPQQVPPGPPPTGSPAPPWAQQPPAQHPQHGPETQRHLPDVPTPDDDDLPF